MDNLVICERQDLVDIADAIREKIESSDGLTLDGMAEAINGIEAGGGSVKHGIITPATNTQTLTIEHGYGSSDYNFYTICALDSIGAYSKAVCSASAFRHMTTQSYASLSFEYSGSTKGTVSTLSGTSFGHLYKQPASISINTLELTTTTGVFPINSSYPDVVFKAGIRYFWLVTKI